MGFETLMLVEIWEAYNYGEIYCIHLVHWNCTPSTLWWYGRMGLFYWIYCTNMVQRAMSWEFHENQKLNGFKWEIHGDGDRMVDNQPTIPNPIPFHTRYPCIPPGNASLVLELFILASFFISVASLGIFDVRMGLQYFSFQWPH